MRPSSKWYTNIESHGGMIDRGKPKISKEKILPTATLFTTNPTWTDPDANPSLRGERPAANRLSHGTVQHYSWSIVYFFHQQLVQYKRHRCAAHTNSEEFHFHSTRQTQWVAVMWLVIPHIATSVIRGLCASCFHSFALLYINLHHVASHTLR
jgi:hypothetical protein